MAITSVINQKGGVAKTTTTVDLSNTYLEWAKENMALNQFTGDNHQFIQADCLAWLKQTTVDKKYDLIFLDPPTFSNSKRMQNTMDIQRDHVEIVEATMALLKPNGVLFFSNNKKNFKLDSSLTSQFDVKNITKQTIPKDFERYNHIHQCWIIKL